MWGATALVIVALLFSTGRTLWHGYQRSLAEAGEQASRLARALEEHAARSFGAIDGTLASLAAPASDPRLLQPRLQAALRTLPQVDRLAVQDTGGRWTSAGLLPFDPAEWADSSDFPETGLLIGRVVEENGEGIVLVGRRLHDATGRFAGLAVAGMAPSYFDGFYQDLAADGQGLVALLHREGDILFPSSARSSDLPQDPDRAVRAEHGVHGYPLAVLVALPRDRTLAPWRDQAWPQALQSLAVTALLLLAAFLLGSWLRRSHASETYFRAAAEGRLDAFLLLGCLRDDKGMVRDFRLHYINERGAALLARPVETLIDRPLSQSLPNAPELLRACLAALTLPGPQKSDIALSSPSGRMLLRCQIVPLANGLAVSARDITEMRAATQRLEESEERFRSLVELSPDAILVHAGGRIAFANAAALQVFRAAGPEELTGRSLLDLVHEHDRAALRARILGRGRSKGPFEERYVRLDGQVFEAEAMSADITLQGMPAHQVVIRDVTERRQMQAQLLQSAKLAILGEMAAGMAHELSQPLNIIRMAADGTLMMMRNGRSDEAHQRRQFTLISEQTGRMAEIIDHIRIFSRKEQGSVVVFDAVATVKRALDLVEQQIRGEGVTLRISLPAEVAPVQGRPVQLEQVVVNLLTNALDALRERAAQEGRPASWQPAIVMTAELGPDMLRLGVSDNGTGIPNHLLDRLFEPFFTTKAAGRGTGLGLSVSFSIVDAMGGLLSAGNNDDGATFTLTLPLVKENSIGSGTASPLVNILPFPAAQPGRHLLLVEDEPAALAAMAAFFENAGYRVSTARGGNEAWRSFQADPPDLIVTDIRMAEGDGETLIERVRDFDPFLPIVVVTGHLGATDQIGDEHRERLLVMKKPVSLRDLAEGIESLLAMPV
ncbi:ATP-binding protein [Telmatospirillum sp. J64-1]|uniref:ATP-binding protein n=1 Tax=Telmatospirillum sp. J64-1 TaxID=2502183 RepID=UPI001C8F5122|nr:ATP-binding protein [Telmatospirillum sp. J64-1]